MKTLMSLTAALVAVAVLAGASLAQTPAPATPAPAKAPVVKNLTGEFVALDKTAKTVTVTHVVDNKASQLTLSVDDSLLTALAQFKAGDKIKVTYEETGGKYIATTIVKV
jgi:Cu/Ag efflux protein CusF